MILGVVIAAGWIAGCSGSGGSQVGTVVELPTGDRFSVELPTKWTVEKSDDAGYLFGHGEGAIFVWDEDCESARECQVSWARLHPGETSQETIGGVTYYEHSYYVEWGGNQEHWYVDWNGHVYDITLSLVGKASEDPTKVRAIVRSFTWLS